VIPSDTSQIGGEEKEEEMMEWNGIDPIMFHPFFKNPNNGISFHSIPFHPKPLIQTEP
jgi:hypothetical protein